MDSKYARLIITVGVRRPFSIAKMPSILVEKKIQPTVLCAGSTYLVMGVADYWEAEVPSLDSLYRKSVGLAGDAEHFSTGFPNLVDYSAFYIASQLEATGRSP